MTISILLTNIIFCLIFSLLFRIRYVWLIVVWSLITLDPDCRCTHPNNPWLLRSVRISERRTFLYSCRYVCVCCVMCLPVFFVSSTIDKPEILSRTTFTGYFKMNALFKFNRPYPLEAMSNFGRRFWYLAYVTLTIYLPSPRSTFFHKSSYGDPIDTLASYNF